MHAWHTVLWLALVLMSGSAHAHRPSDAFVTLEAHGPQLRGQWEIALRDLAMVADLDANHDGALTWGELRRAAPTLEPSLTESLGVQGDGRPCPLRITDLRLNDRIDGRFAWFSLIADCEAPPRQLSIDYRFLFALDPSHRGMLTLGSGDAWHSAVMGPDDGPRRFALHDPSRWQSFRDYLKNGIWHIWIGYDHILFLLALLVPAVLRASEGRWEPQPRLRDALWDVMGVVTAFTVAHSITLTLAALNVLRLPSQWVELAIAASVLLAALNNLWPLVERRRSAIAFGFGLIHGFGFASVLGELGLPGDARLLALIAFNAGVEIGQLAIVVAVVPVAFRWRASAFYISGVRTIGSILVSMMAVYWMLQRSGLVVA